MRCPSKLRLKVVGVNLYNSSSPWGAKMSVPNRQSQIAIPKPRAAVRLPTRGFNAQYATVNAIPIKPPSPRRSEEHTSELQSQFHLVCRLLLEKKKKKKNKQINNKKKKKTKKKKKKKKKK